MFKSLDHKIRTSFNKSANRYDVLTSLHKEIGRELVKKHVHNSAKTLLDIGCGTGYVTSKMKFFYPESRIVGLDIAQAMLDKAAEKHEGSNIEWVLGNAMHLPFGDNEIDIIFSNLAYQWVTDLPKAFCEAKRVLNKDGLFAITLFGGRTCEELFQSLSQANVSGIGRLPSVEQTKQALVDAGFQDIDVDYELIKIQFTDMWELLNWLKAIGANQLAYDGFIGKEQFQRAANFYKENFPYHQGVCASFEVIWIKA